MNNHFITPISPEHAQTLSGLFYQRVKSTPNKTAYHSYDAQHQTWKTYSWIDALHEVIKWQQLLLHFELKRGDSIAIMLKNCPEWIFMEQAALALGIIVVPLYNNDRADNIAYILNQAEVKLLLLGGPEHLQELVVIQDQVKQLRVIITLETIDEQRTQALKNINLYPVDQVFKQLDAAGAFSSDDYIHFSGQADDLATIVYTSGTTGDPKGVMLSHYNILSNTWSAINAVPCRNDDLFLSFLPLSHMFERTAGYYIPMMSGAEVAYARSIEDLGADLLSLRPTVLVTVPRIFERVYFKIKSQLEKKPRLAQVLFAMTVQIGWKRFQYLQHKQRWFPELLLWPLLNQLVAKKITAKLGGRIRVAISGGAPLPNEIARAFIGLGVTITQGYGLTETSPVISTNKLEDNDPFSVGQILPGIKIRLSDQGELLVKSPGVMQGYWKHRQATEAVIDEKQWLHTGDKAELRNDHLYITGRVKEILVLSNGEKVPPTDLEMAITSDPLFEQALVVGEARPYLSAVIVINEELWPDLAAAAHVENQHDIEQSLDSHELKQYVLNKISQLLHAFPGYEQIRNVKLVMQLWTIENGFLTPTMKLKRNRLLDYFQKEIEALYSGHPHT